MNIIVIPAFLSPAECDEVIKQAPRVAPGDVNSSAKAVRRSRVAFLPYGPLVGRVREALMQINTRHFHFDLVGVEPLQVAEYGFGDKYDDHLDIGPGTASLRKLSASVQLSDPNDYDGGDLRVWGTKEAADRERGSLIAFASWSVHRVEPVTRGLRRSLVAWAVGALPYR